MLHRFPDNATDYSRTISHDSASGNSRGFGGWRVGGVCFASRLLNNSTSSTGCRQPRCFWRGGLGREQGGLPGIGLIVFGAEVNSCPLVASETLFRLKGGVRSGEGLSKLSIHTSFRHDLFDNGQIVRAAMTCLEIYF